MSAPGAPAGAVGDAVARAVSSLLDDVFDAIGEVGEAYRLLWERLLADAAGAAGGSGDSGDSRREVVAEALDVLREPIQRRLAAAPAFVGCGVVVAPNLLRDRPHHLVWWERGPGVAGAGAAPKRLVLDLDPNGEDSYDYPSMPWFAAPRDEGRRAVTGPYVDFRGANRYVYTFAVPVRSDGEFLGVAGADVSVQDFEPLLLAALKPLAVDAVVVAADRRVVVANSGRWSVGARLRSFPEPGAQGFASVHPVADDLGWVLAVTAG